MTMIASGLGGGGGKNNPSLPRDVKDAVSKCRASVQKALEQRISRMDIEMPVGAKFGVEKSSSKKKRSSSSENEGVTKATLDRSNRELARIFVEMFQPLGGNSIAVIFNQASAADEARKMWKGDANSQCNVLSMGRKKDKKVKKKKPMGFAAKMEAELSSKEGGPFNLPDQCELAVFVSPGPKELVTIHRICRDVDMGTLVVLLNTRLTKIDNFGSDDAKTLFMEEFEPVFHLAAAPQEVAPGCLLHRSYPNDWVLARKPKVGQPKVIATDPNRLGDKECKQAYDNMEIGDMEEAFEGVLDNVANWFK